MLLYCVQDTMLTLYCQLLNHVMEKLLSLQHGALPILYNQRRHVHRLMQIYAVPPWRIIQQLEQRPFQGDQKLFRIILRSTTKTTTNQQRGRGWKRGWSHSRLWRLSKPRLPTTNTHVRSTSTNWRRLYSYEYIESLERFQEPHTATTLRRLL